MVVIALDVGGSSVKHGVVDFNNPLQTQVQTTPINSRGTVDEIIETFAKIIHSHRQSHPNCVQLALGFPGPFDYEQGISHIRGLEKYEALYNMNVHDLLLSMLHRPDVKIRFRNDAEAAIVGEAIYGVGANYARIIGITLGTGMGSAFLNSGERVTDGPNVPEQGWLYPELFKDQRADDVFSTRGLLSRFAASNIVLPHVAAADIHDKRVQEILSVFGDDLGQFLLPYANIFKADAILILGGIVGFFELFDNPLKTQLSPIPVLRGHMGEQAALLGAASLFRHG